MAKTLTRERPTIRLLRLQFDGNYTKCLLEILSSGINDYPQVHNRVLHMPPDTYTPIAFSSWRDDWAINVPANVWLFLKTTGQPVSFQEKLSPSSRGTCFVLKSVHRGSQTKHSRLDSWAKTRGFLKLWEGESVWQWHFLPSDGRILVREYTIFRCDTCSKYQTPSFVISLARKP